MALNDLELRRLSARPKPYKVADTLGLYVQVQTTGAKLWRFKYRFHGYERKLNLGRYPDISLAKARQRRDEARQMLADGRDPVTEKHQAEAEAKLSQATTFKEVGEEFIERMVLEEKSQPTLTKMRWFMRLLDREIAHRPISKVTPHELLVFLRKIETRGHRETAVRLRAFAGRVFRYGIVTQRCTANPADLLRGALINPRARLPSFHLPSALLSPGTALKIGWASRFQRRRQLGLEERRRSAASLHASEIVAPVPRRGMSHHIPNSLKTLGAPNGGCISWASYM